MARGSDIVQRAKGSWTFRIDIGRDPATGKRIQKTVTVRGTKRDAERERTRMLLEVDEGRVSTGGAITVAQFCTRWLRDHVQPNKAPRTFLECQGAVRNYIIPLLGTQRLDKLKPIQIVTFQAQLRERPRLDGHGTLAASTQANIYAVLHAALATAVQWKIIATNPCTSIAAPRSQTAEMTALDPAGAGRFIAAAALEPAIWYAFFVLALTSGLRFGELRGLRWQDINIPKQTLTVRVSAQRLPRHGTTLRAPKTASSRRTVALGTEVIVLLKRHKAEQNETRLQAGAAWQDRDLIFTAATGDFASEYHIRVAFQRIVARAELPPMRIHDLRHSAATLMLVAGVNPKVVSERLGHADVALTLQVYSHVSETLQQQAAASLDTLLESVKSVIKR